jgi:hypothetical protein
MSAYRFSQPCIAESIAFCSGIGFLLINQIQEQDYLLSLSPCLTLENFCLSELLSVLSLLRPKSH